MSQQGKFKDNLKETNDNSETMEWLPTEVLLCQKGTEKLKMRSGVADPSRSFHLALGMGQEQKWSVPPSFPASEIPFLAKAGVKTDLLLLSWFIGLLQFSLCGSGKQI